MKKTIKALAAVMVVLTLCLGLLAGCASGGFTGHWKAVSMSAMGMEMDVSSMNMTMDIREDGTATTSALGITTDQTWTKIDDSSFEMQGTVYKLQGGQLIAEEDGSKVVFGR